MKEQHALDSIKQILKCGLENRVDLWSLVPPVTHLYNGRPIPAHVSRKAMYAFFFINSLSQISVIFLSKIIMSFKARGPGGGHEGVDDKRGQEKIFKVDKN